MLYAWITIAIIILLIGIIIVFNSLVGQRNRSKNAWSDIDVQLKRRYDLIPNLVATVKSYKEYEAVVLSDVTAARANAINFQSTGAAARAQAENTLTVALKSLLAVAENYPRLRASENFQQLQDQLAAVENDIQSARRYYNATARELNNAVQVFPARLIAGIFGFKPAEFFGLDEGERGTTKISF